LTLSRPNERRPNLALRDPLDRINFWGSHFIDSQHSKDARGRQDNREPSGGGTPKTQTRALAVAGIVTSLELARRTDALIPDRLEEHTILFRAVTLALKEVTLAFKVFAEHLNPAEQ
jgi:hypothetical protein